jgi:hypothetical protein
MTPCDISEALDCLRRLSTASAAIVVEFAVILLVYEFADSVSNGFVRRVVKFGHLALGHGQNTPYLERYRYCDGELLHRVASAG